MCFPISPSSRESIFFLRGTRLLWNIGTAMTKRVRFIIWQLQRASRQEEVRQARSSEETGSRYEAL